MAVDEHETIRREVAGFQSQFDKIVANVEQVVKGKPDVVRLAVTCMLADGHLLIEDVPGVGKTTLARALAETIDGSLQRIQFTPDLLPDRRHRRADLQPGQEHVRVPRWSGIRQHRARGRDQPCVAQDTGRPRSR